MRHGHSPGTRATRSIFSAPRPSPGSGRAIPPLPNSHQLEFGTNGCGRASDVGVSDPRARSAFSLILIAWDAGTSVFFLFDLLHLDSEAVDTSALVEQERFRTLLSHASPPPAVQQ
jgi:hypothetical protein